MKILGIETSCDDTGVGIVNTDTQHILAHQVYTQSSEHADYGGVVPEIASRAHQKHLPQLVKQALAEANLSFDELDGIAATTGPGLLGGLLVGSHFAKSLSLATNKPFIGVNHLEAHALTAVLTEKSITFPYLLLLVSGGHCQFIQVNNFGDYQTLGGTLDDAVGECFDKSAKLLGLGYPGGPLVEKHAQAGNPQKFALPIPLNDGSVNFSFSGLKTAVRNCVQKIDTMNEATMADLCASLQHTIARTLLTKTKVALTQSRAKNLVLAGGVAANKLIRSELEQLCTSQNIGFYAPPINLCTDNGVMIAFAGGLHFQAYGATPLADSCKPRWPLDTLNTNKKAAA